jgi:catechol 2,3-dioxygenase-like lactoylglutathione lyase family enzyme
MKERWPDGFTATQVRIARPTSQLQAVISFYREGLGLLQIGSFEHHAGYSGVMVGLPGRDYHLEFTQHETGSPCPAPTKDNLLVFYIPNKKELEMARARLERLGHLPVAPENPYWEEFGITFQDPDGWRIVLMNTEGLPDWNLS